MTSDAPLPDVAPVPSTDGPKVDAGLPPVDMAAADAGTVSFQLKAAWTATFAAYLNLSFQSLVMSATATPPATVQVNATLACPGGGSHAIAGPVTVAAGRSRTMSMLTVTFTGCDVNGIKIDGTWAVVNDTMPTTGGFESYKGDLTYSGLYSGTCPTDLVRNITPAAPTGTWQGSFCNEDIAKFK